MRWHVHGERSLYDCEWVRLSLVDVVLPCGRRFEHHVVRMPASAAARQLDVDQAEADPLAVVQRALAVDAPAHGGQASESIGSAARGLARLS